MCILITGAGGNIGKGMVPRLTAAGHDLVLSDLNKIPDAEPFAGLPFVQCDVQAGFGLERARRLRPHPAHRSGTVHCAPRLPTSASTDLHLLDVFFRRRRAWRKPSYLRSFHGSYHCPSPRTFNAFNRSANALLWR